MLALLLATVLGGCTSTQPGTYPTIKQTQLNVTGPMTRYQTAAGFGGLTLAEKERMNSAIAAYRAAYNQALQAAGGNADTPAPDYLNQRANELIQTLAGIPLIR
ncbi:MAG: hypothetical protein JWR26_4332 [Pedosphaera sp.]|nr:hypothetical protein [Pedosphaera sp.]